MNWKQRFKFHSHCEFENTKLCILGGSAGDIFARRSEELTWENDKPNWGIGPKTLNCQSIKKQESTPNFQSKIMNWKRIYARKEEINCLKAGFKRNMILFFKLCSPMHFFLYFFMSSLDKGPEDELEKYITIKLEGNERMNFAASVKTQCGLFFSFTLAAFKIISSYFFTGFTAMCIDVIFLVFIILGRSSALYIWVFISFLTFGKCFASVSITTASVPFSLFLFYIYVKISNIPNVSWSLLCIFHLSFLFVFQSGYFLLACTSVFLYLICW